MAKQNATAAPAAPERKWTLGSARELVLFLTALVALVTPIVGFATGGISLSGLSFFGSPGFWCVYSFLLVILMTAVADYYILRWLHQNLDRQGFRFTNSAPDVFFAMAHAPWFLLFVPYLFMAGHFAGRSALEGPSVLVATVAFFGSISGGILIALAVDGANKIINPRHYKQYSARELAARTT